MSTTSTNTLQTYKKLVDYCEKNQLKDYFTGTPLLCYINRDEFIHLMDTAKLNNTVKVDDTTNSIPVDDTTNTISVNP